MADLLERRRGVVVDEELDRIFAYDDEEEGEDEGWEEEEWDEEDEDWEDDEEEDEDAEDDEVIRLLRDEDDLAWIDDEESFEQNEALLQLEETVETLLDEQEVAPECPHCHEYMLEAGSQVVTADTFLPRVPESLGQAVLDTPFSLTMYVCPACFTVQHALDERSRTSLARRLSRTDRS